MATLTVGPELAVVDIVGQMAIRAIAPKTRLVSERPAMTGFAVRIGVCARQGEVSLQVVIERPLRPGDRVVAETAVGAEEAVVRLVVPVTIDTRLRGVAENMRIMAGIALGLFMLAEQRELRQAMVEEDLVLPGQFVVAILAGCAQGLFVWLVFFVTGETLGFQRHIEHRLDVTRGALGLRVLAEQSMPGVDGMIESYVGPTSRHMARVALLAEVGFVVVILLVAGKAHRR